MITIDWNSFAVILRPGVERVAFLDAHLLAYFALAQKAGNPFREITTSLSTHDLKLSTAEEFENCLPARPSTSV